MNNQITKSNKFNKSFIKLCASLNKRQVENVLNRLEEFSNNIDNPIYLKNKFSNHKLKGDMKNKYDAHIQDDIVLIYTKENKSIILQEIGPHKNVLNSDYSVLYDNDFLICS